MNLLNIYAARLQRRWAVSCASALPSFLGAALVAAASRRLPPGELALLACVQPAAAAVLGALVLHQPVNAVQSVGLVAVVAGLSWSTSLRR
jgi:threonine/homoserine efflux transporter RhtA